MPVRTTATLVQGVLMDDYGPRADGSLPSLIPFIAAASAVVDRVQQVAPRKGYTVSVSELEIMERWLAAHMYCMSDKALTSKSTGGASGNFAGQTSNGFQATLYGQTAIRLDFSGVLRNIDERQFARLIWLGKPPSDQIPYDQRD